jgi:hypothetical protein
MLVIELKYIRISFVQNNNNNKLESTIKKTQQTIWKDWKDIDNSLPLEIKDDNDLDKFVLLDYFSDKDINGNLKLVPLSKILKNAREQCLNYTFLLSQGSITPDNKELKVKIFSCVIMGVGTHIYYDLSQTL